MVAAPLCGGAAWRWLADNVGSWLRALALPCPEPDRLFAKISELGLAAPDALTVRPHFLGERHDTSLRGSIEGIDLTNFGLGQLARGLAQGILVNCRDMLPAWVLEGRCRLVGSGNALRRTPLLQRMAQEVFRLPLVLAEAKEEAATGAALNAAGLPG